MWQRVAVDWLGLPSEAVLDLPHIAWTANVELSVLNHRGLVLYTPERIVVASSVGPVRVEGEILAVRRVTAESVHIVGRVRAVRVGR